MKHYAKFETVKLKSGKKKLKGTKSVLEHCIDTGLLSKILLESSSYRNFLSFFRTNLKLSESEIIKFVSFFISLHDIGKIHPYFQAKSSENLKYMYENSLIDKIDYVGLLQYVKTKGNLNSPYHLRHEVFSKRVILDYYKVSKESKVIQSFIEVLSLHHEKNNLSDLRKKPKNLYWYSEIEKTIKELEKVFNYSLFDLDFSKIDNVDALCFLLLGLLEFCDWLASSKYFCATENILDIESIGVQKYIENQNNLGRFVLEYNLGQLNQEKFQSDFSYLFTKKDYSLRGIQKEVLNIVADKNKKLILIEGPMGEGKTEAGLYASGKMPFNKNGFYFALPTSATSDSMYNRIEKIFKRQNLTNLNLLHSDVMSDKLYFKGIKDYYSFLNSSNTGLFVKNGVGTIDQAILTVLKNKFSSLRLLGLFDKVLIIDEVHAFDVYMSVSLFILLNWANTLNIPVILMSATLPQNKKKELLESYLGYKYTKELNTGYPLITTVDLENQICETVVKEVEKTKKIEYSILTNSEDVKLKVLEKLYSGKNVGIVCNTVKESQLLYKKFSHEGIKNIVCLNSLEKLKHRSEKEKKIVEVLGEKDRTSGLLVIGTQILEQSLDIDFDVLFTYLCPIDLLYQRMGRFERFDIAGREKEPYVYIILDDDSYKISKYIYHPLLLSRTKKWIKKFKHCNLPMDFRDSIDYVYNTTNYTVEEEEMINSYNIEQNVIKDIGEISTFDPFENLNFQRKQSDKEYPILLDNDSFYGSRLSIPTIKVLFITKKEIENIGVNVLKCCEDSNILKLLQGEVIKIRLSLLSFKNIEDIKNNETDFCFFGGKLLKHYLIIGADVINASLVVDINGNEIKYNKDYGLEINN